MILIIYNLNSGLIFKIHQKKYPNKMKNLFKMIVKILIIKIKILLIKNINVKFALLF